MAVLSMPSIVRVILDRAQEIEAHEAAMARALGNDSNPDSSHMHLQALNYHDFIAYCAEAAGAEIAVAAYFNVPHFKPTVDTYHSQADIGDNIEVKYTKYNTGQLIVQANHVARLKDIAILVVGKSPVYAIVGWIPITFAMQSKYLHSQQGNYWIPQANLFEMKYLQRSNYGNS
jgi:hypothetical protein